MIFDFFLSLLRNKNYSLQTNSLDKAKLKLRYPHRLTGLKTIILNPVVSNCCFGRNFSVFILFVQNLILVKIFQHIFLLLSFGQCLPPTFGTFTTLLHWKCKYLSKYYTISLYCVKKNYSEHVSFVEGGKDFLFFVYALLSKSPLRGEGGPPIFLPPKN